MRKNLILEIIFALIVLGLLYIVDQSNKHTSSFYFRTEDIHYEYQAAKQIQHGENPYLRILEGNLLENDKYTTLLPFYYYFLLILRVFSGNEFSQFISNFGNILFLAQAAGGLFIYLFFRRAHKRLLGLVAAVIYMFNLWTLDSYIFLKQDILAIALLLGSLYFFNTKSKLSYLLFGLSIGIKHIGIFVFPLYLTPLFFKKQSFKQFSINFLIFLIPVLLPTIPFLVDNFESFLKSMLFSFTRTLKYGDITFGYQRLLVNYSDSGLNGTLFDFLLPRAPLVLITGLNIFLLFTRRIPKLLYASIAILIFAIFNPVIFPQYITWIPPLFLIGASGIE